MLVIGVRLEKNGNVEQLQWNEKSLFISNYNQICFITRVDELKSIFSCRVNIRRPLKKWGWLSQNLSETVGSSKRATR